MKKREGQTYIWNAVDNMKPSELWVQQSNKANTGIDGTPQ